MKSINFSFKKFLNTFFDRFVETNTTTWAASVAFYTSLSLAPLLILFVTIASKLSPHIQETFVNEATYLVGPQAAEIIQMIINNAKDRADLSSLSGILGFIALLLSASFIFGELRAALNQMFSVKKKTDEPIYFLQSLKNFFKIYILQMGIAFAFLFIMIVSLIISTTLSATLYTHDAVSKVVTNVLISLFFFSGLFTLLFRYIPTQHLTWPRAWQAGFITTLLFVCGKELIGLYLGNSAFSSSYGAAGSLVVLLAWVYYSSMIIFIGAHCAWALTSSQIIQQVPSKEAPVM